MAAESSGGQAKGGAVKELVPMLEKAGPEAKQAMRQALGVGGVIQKAQSQSNSDAKRIAYSGGEIVQPDGFMPKPSETTVSKGPEAGAEWRAAWLARQQNPSSKAEEYAAVAVE